MWGYASEQHSDVIGYFSDSSGCFRTSVRKVPLKAPTDKTMTVVEVPIGHDAELFSLCMEYAGHLPNAGVNAEEYLNISRACLEVAVASEIPDATYATCVRHANISVNTI